MPQIGFMSAHGPSALKAPLRKAASSCLPQFSGTFSRKTGLVIFVGVWIGLDDLLSRQGPHTIGVRHVSLLISEGSGGSSSSL